MVEPLFGPLPAGWAESFLGELTDLTPGTVLKDPAPGATPLVKPSNLVDGVLSEPARRVLGDTIPNVGRSTMRTGDVLLSRTGRVGRVALVQAEQDGWIFDTGLIRIRPREGLDPTYLALYLASPQAQAWMAQSAVGSAVQHLSAHVMKRLPVRVPPPEALRQITELLKALNAKISAHRLICETTAELRDALLPLLLSGQASFD